MTDNQKLQIAELRVMGTGYGKIAQILGLSQNTVKSYCRRNNIGGVKAVTVKAKIPETIYCKCCGKEIHQAHGHKPKQFCCDKCRNKWWNAHLDMVKRKAIYRYKCLNCGREFEVYGNSHRKYCSHECYIADRFKGGDCNE